MTLSATRLGRAARGATIALLVSVSFAACGGGAPSTDVSRPSSDTAPSQSSLEAALITLDDLPPGMREAPDDSDASDPSDTTDDDACIAAMSDLTEGRDEPDVEAKRTFIRDGSTASVVGTIGYYKDADQLRDHLDHINQVLQDCPTASATSDGLTLDVTISSEEIDVHGADAALRVVMHGPMGADGISFDFNATAELTVKGHILSVVSTSSLDDTSLTDEIHDLATHQFDNVLALK